MSTPGDPRGLVAAAVRGTIHGSAQISVRGTLSFEAQPWDAEFHGVIDFASDRCRLEGQERLILDGPAEYTHLDDGRWTHQSGPPGTWGLLHPRGALESLRKACSAATVLTESKFSVQLDRDALDEIADLGLAPAWSVSASVALDKEGRIISLARTFTDATESTGPMLVGAMCVTFEFKTFGDPVRIDLPPTESTLSLADHVDELLPDGDADPTNRGSDERCR